MRAERSIVTSPEPEYVFKVMQWKWEPDPSAPWWQRKYFHWIYLPFQNFSLKWFKVPPMKEVTIESDEHGNVRRTFAWFEDEAILLEEDQADRACLGEHWGYRKTAFNRLHPSESTQTFGTVFPRKKNPRKWAIPTFSMFAKSRKKEEQEQQSWKECLRRLNQVLDK